MTEKQQRLIEWRNEQGITWTELASRLGFDLSYIFRIANGERPVTDSFIGRFAQVYGFDVAAQVFGQAETA